jgi:hypothetical protein
MAGVRIGHGAVLGAASLVTSDVEPYAVIGGVPARLIKYRFTASQIARLLVLRWWDLNDALLSDVVEVFYQRNVGAAIDELERCAAMTDGSNLLDRNNRAARPAEEH